MSNKQKYQPLVRGDIRQSGDEVRPQKTIGIYNGPINEHLIPDWQPVRPSRVGQPIDFMDIRLANYRRPIHE